MAMCSYFLFILFGCFIQQFEAEVCPWEHGYCAKQNGAIQMKGRILLGDLERNSPEQQASCLAKCRAYTGATGCMAYLGITSRCYVYTSVVARGRGGTSHMCWVFSKCRTMAISPAAPACPKKHGYCTKQGGWTQFSQRKMLAVVRISRPEYQDICLAKCRSYTGATGCMVTDLGGCFVYTSLVVGGKGGNKHACWVLSKCQGPPATAAALTIATTTTTIRTRMRFPNVIRGIENGRSYVQGHVEIYHEKRWGTICDDKFSSNAANVLCRMAGYMSGDYGARYKQPWATKANKVWLSELVCSTGRESNIDACSHLGWGQNDCGHFEDVGIRCYVSETTTHAIISSTSSFDLAACIGGVIGAIILIILAYIIRKKVFFSETSTPVSHNVDYQTANVHERPPLLSVNAPQIVNGNDAHGRNPLTSPSAPPMMTSGEEENELPENSTLTDISDAPPKYQSMFPSRHTPRPGDASSSHDADLPPSYQEATTQVVM